MNQAEAGGPFVAGSSSLADLTRLAGCGSGRSLKILVETSLARAGDCGRFVEWERRPADGDER